MQPIRARLTSPEGWAKKDLWSAGNVLVAMSWQRKESGINCMDECMDECIDEIIMQYSHKVFCPWSHRFDSRPPATCPGFAKDVSCLCGKWTNGISLLIVYPTRLELALIFTKI